MHIHMYIKYINSHTMWVFKIETPNQKIKYFTAK